MNEILLAISWLGIGVWWGIIGTYFLIVRPLQQQNTELRKAAIMGIKNQLDLILRFVGSTSGEPVISPIQLEK